MIIIIDFIERTLHVKPDVYEYTKTDQIPLYLRKGYHLTIMGLLDTRFLVAEPDSAINLVTLRKQREQLKRISGMECVLYFYGINPYTRNKMLEEGIPFIQEGKQIYLPFLGMALSNQTERNIPKIQELSFLTQKLLLMAIYEDFSKISVTQTADKMGVSKMSATRCFDELESLGTGLIKKIGRSRYFIWEHTNIDLWKLMRPYLRNPVVRKYELDKCIEVPEEKLGGISAISYYTMLEDNNYRTLAVIKATETALDLKHLPCVPHGEQPEQVIQVLSYEIAYQHSQAVDPLTAILSLTDEEMAEPRVEKAVDRLLEEQLNGNRNGDIQRIF